MINGILYVKRTGCQWRMLPVKFPPWYTVYYYLTLRSQLNGMQFLQSGKGRLDGVQGEIGLESRVIEFGVAFTLTGTREQFELDAATQSRKEMIGLRCHPFGWVTSPTKHSV